MLRSSGKRFACAVSALALAAVVGTTGASAQTHYLPSEVSVTPGIGAGLDTMPSNGGQPIRVQEEQPQMRPSVAQSEWSTSLEYESWSAQGARFVGGRRTSLLIGYARGLSPNAEVTVNLPLQQVKVGAFMEETGLGDVEMAYHRYFYNQEDPAAPTFVLTGRAFLPTGDINKAIGTGEFSYGASGTVSKPFGRTLGYAGVGYTVVGEPAGMTFENVLYYWAGGVTPINPRWSLQYEGLHFNSPVNERYTRALLGARYSLTPSMGLQLNLKREFQADGNPFTISLGYAGRM